MSKADKQFAASSEQLKRSIYMLLRAAEQFRGQDFTLNPDRNFGFRGSKDLMRFAQAQAKGLSIQLENLQ